MKIFNPFKKKAVVKTVSDNAMPAAGRVLLQMSYDGEKNFGEIGPIKDYAVDYASLSMRSWQSYLESEISQTVLGKYFTWVIGAGLKLQAEPVVKVLELEGVNIGEEFNDIVESRFGIYANSKMSAYSGMSSLHMLAKEAFKNSIVGGDVLVVLRYIDDQVKVQLIDGAHIQTPLGNREAKHGISISTTGEHLGFYVRTGLLDFKYIPAKTNGITTAFMIYGLKYRIDTHRGMPLISVVMETLKKLERYKEATVGSAEERQKITYFAEHKLGSTGENPLGNSLLAKAINADASPDLPRDVNGKDLSNKFAATTGKQMINMPIDSTLKSLESKNELYFKDFYSVNIDLVCAAVGIPPEVAMSKYDSNFSASRAALKDWENTLNVSRREFSFQFYQNVYNFWLHTEVLKNKIPAKGYLKAWNQNDQVVLESYRKARFVGASVPHIDPVKEVAAERAKLGPLARFIPLTTVEAATEALNSGDSNANIDQFAKEMDSFQSFTGVDPREMPMPNQTSRSGSSNA